MGKSLPLSEPLSPTLQSGDDADPSLLRDVVVRIQWGPQIRIWLWETRGDVDWGEATMVIIVIGHFVEVQSECSGLLQLFFLRSYSSMSLWLISTWRLFPWASDTNQLANICSIPVPVCGSGPAYPSSSELTEPPTWWNGCSFGPFCSHHLSPPGVGWLVKRTSFSKGAGPRASTKESSNPILGEGSHVPGSGIWSCLYSLDLMKRSIKKQETINQIKLSFSVNYFICLPQHLIWFIHSRDHSLNFFFFFFLGYRGLNSRQMLYRSSHTPIF
jgi:hypothetical protein